MTQQQDLTDLEKHAFITGYLRGTINAIYGLYEPKHTSKQKIKKWEKLTQDGVILHIFLIDKLGLSMLSLEYGKLLIEMENEINELIRVYAK